MLCSPGNKINDSQVIGELIDTNYKTKTGGFYKIQGDILMVQEDQASPAMDLRGNTRNKKRHISY